MKFVMLTCFLVTLSCFGRQIPNEEDFDMYFKMQFTAILEFSGTEKNFYLYS